MSASRNGNMRSSTAGAGAASNGLASSRLVASGRGLASQRGIEFKARKAPYVAAKAVGSFVPGLTRKTFEKFGFATAQLITDWADVVGAEMARYTCPDRIRWPRLPMGGLDDMDGGAGRGGATLLLRVDPARALDIEYKRAQLMERINAYFGYRAVADIRIVQGTIERGGAEKTGAVTPARPAAARSSGPASAVAVTALDTVPDERLRQALERMQAAIRGRATS